MKRIFRGIWSEFLAWYPIRKYTMVYCLMALSEIFYFWWHLLTIVIIQLFDREILFYSDPINITSIDFFYTCPKRRGVERLGEPPPPKKKEGQDPPNTPFRRQWFPGKKLKEWGSIWCILKWLKIVWKYEYERYGDMPPENSETNNINNAH